MSKFKTASASALMLLVSIAATLSGWMVLSVVRPVPLKQVRVEMPVTTLPVVIRAPAAAVPQPIAITRSSN